jgi:Tol biopolymer transport system component
LQATIAFTSTRNGHGEIYLLEPGSSEPRRLTTSVDTDDGLPTLSPGGKQIVFDSNRNIPPVNGVRPINRSELFGMDADGADQTFLAPGSSATWAPDCKHIAFHASATGTGTPLRPNPGSATSDSDLFVANVDDLRTGAETPINITNSTDKIDDDPDWSPNGHTIAYTAHDITDNPLLSTTAEIYLINADGTGTPTALTHNFQEERAPAWSPDGTQIAYMCGIAGPPAPFEICVMNADGTDVRRLTSNSVFDGGPSWSPDGNHILFARFVPGAGQQLFVIEPRAEDPITNNAILLTPGPNQGVNTLAKWGVLRVHAEP